MFNREELFIILQLASEAAQNDPSDINAAKLAEKIRTELGITTIIKEK
jgi:hypothetical protein